MNLEKDNFLQLYLQQVGLWNTPKQWHFWSAISLLAASVGNNIHVNITGEPLYPNLYIFLVGLSGHGKGDAINLAAKFVKNAAEDPQIAKHKTRNMTKQGVHDKLRSLEPDAPTALRHGSRMWLICEELGDAMPAGPMAMDFIKYMTGLYVSDSDESWDMTRASGALSVNNPMINWLAGSVPDWLFQSVDESAITGGFFARTLVIWGEKVKDDMAPSFLHNRKAIQDEIKERIEAFKYIKSEMVYHPDAWYYLVHDWYPNRAKSDDPDKAAIFNRDNTMVWKLSMLACLSEQPVNHTGIFYPEIQKRHVLTAVQWYEQSREHIDTILYYAHRSRETIGLDKTLDVIKRHGTIQRSNLLKALSRLGVKSNELNSIIMTLLERGQIDQEVPPGGTAIYYVYKKRKGH